MPLLSPTGQPDAALAWFRSEAGLAVLDSERALINQAFEERSGQPWLWLAPHQDPVVQPVSASGRGLRLASTSAGNWSGDVNCGLPLPLPSECFGVVVLQHVFASTSNADDLLEETHRILVPGGRAWLFALNPLAPYRWRWRGAGLRAPEPVTWRRRLRSVGLQADPVAQGLGPGWKLAPSDRLQHGPGLRAAYVIRAEKRATPLTPSRHQTALRLAQGAPAA